VQRVALDINVNQQQHQQPRFQRQPTTAAATTVAAAAVVPGWKEIWEEQGRKRGRSGEQVLREVKRIGRRRENPHVLVIPMEQRRKGWENDRKDNYDSQTSSSDSDSEAKWMTSTSVDRMGKDKDELAKMFAQAFPQNPEMAPLAWADEQFEHLRKEDPLITANPTATMTPDDEDNGQALPPLYLDQPADGLAMPEQRTGGAPWDTLDEAALKATLALPMEGSLGGRSCRYLDHWQESCGGYDMMQIRSSLRDGRETRSERKNTR
jgi:hypothetical protein